MDYITILILSVAVIKFFLITGTIYFLANRNRAKVEIIDTLVRVRMKVLEQRIDTLETKQNG